MKFDITIKDATKEEAEKISALLFGVADSSFLVNVPPVQVSAPSTTAHVPTPDANTEETEQVNPAAVSTGEVDSRGFPWNEKIHSGSQKKNADGTWAKRRGVKDDVIAAVEAELKGVGFGLSGTATVNAPAAPAQVVQAPTIVQHQPPAMNQWPEQLQQQQTPVVQQAPVMQQPMQTPAPAQVRDFAALSSTIAGLFQTGQMNPEYISSLCQRIGAQFNVVVNAITDIQFQPQMVNHAFTLLVQDGKVAA